MAVIPSRLTLLLFPKDDDQFTAVVESLSGGDGGQSVHLERRLRWFYPHAVVRPRDRLSEFDPAAETWYVYRDGSAASTLP